MLRNTPRSAAMIS